MGASDRLRPPGAANALAWTLFGVVVALTVAGEVLAVLNLSAPNESDWGSNWGNVASGAAFFTFSVVGILIASRRPGHPVAWVCLAIGLCTALDRVASGYGTYALVTNPGALSGGALMAWVESWIWVVFTLLVGALLLLFPDGRLPSRRWRVVAWVGVAAAAAAVAANALKPGPLEAGGDTVNPVGLEGAAGLLDALDVGTLLLLAWLLASVASVVLRFRRSSGDERLQLKWFASAAGFALLLFLAAFASRDLVPQGIAEPAQDLSLLAVAALPIAVGVAILKYRLYGIDVVISKAVMVTAMAVFVTAVYVGIVVGLGAAIGRAGDPNVALSILATTVVAVPFSPSANARNGSQTGWCTENERRPTRFSPSSPNGLPRPPPLTRSSPRWLAPSPRERARKLPACGCESGRSFSWRRRGLRTGATASSASPSRTVRCPRSRRSIAPSPCAIATSCWALSRWRSPRVSRSPRPKTSCSQTSPPRRRSYCATSGSLRSSSLGCRSSPPLASASWRPRTRRAGGWSETCTTALSSTWSR